MKVYKDASDADESLIGFCTFKLKTMVTKKSDGRFNPPSAAMTAGILAGMAALGALIACYCACCRRREQKVVVVDESSFAGTKRESGTTYTKMEDDSTLESIKRGSEPSKKKMEVDGSLDKSKVETTPGSVKSKDRNIIKFFSLKKKKKAAGTLDTGNASSVV